MAFFSIAALRTILATETDADSPGSEELLGQIRENFEALLMLLLDTNEGGTVTTIAETVLTDSGQAWTVDIHIGRTLLITSGTAIGNTYTIDDSAATTLTLTGDTLVSDGVAITDTFLIFYDLKVNTDGHDHDGVNSKYVNAARMAGIHPALYSESADTAYHVQATWYVYIPADVETIYYHCEISIANSGETVSVKLDVGGQVGEVTHTGDTDFTEKSGTVDVSSLAVGWHEVDYSLKTSNAAHTARTRYLGTYMD